MVLYLIKGSAFRDAYNLLGITIRKAYIVNLHRPPLSHLPEDVRTARMQLWWLLFSLDAQCSLQLDKPAAIQKSLVKCPFPTEDALTRYVSSPSQPEDGIKSHTYSTCLVNLATVVADVCACVSTANLIEEDDSPAALEHYALRLSSALKCLQVWRDQLPTKLLQSQHMGSSRNTEMLDFDRLLALPAWLQRQTVLLELHYHNTYTLIQRPFIHLRYAHSNDSQESQLQHVNLHISGALYHATMTVNTVFAICSISDVLYGWPEVLQPLWNAALTIVAYSYANSPSSKLPQALESLKRVAAIFESFSSTSPAALSAKGITQSLVNYLQSKVSHDSHPVAIDSLEDWGFLTSLVEPQQIFPAGLDSAPFFSDLYGNNVFSPPMTSASHANIADFDLIAIQSGDP